MDTKNTIFIVLASDNHYAVLVAALIKSIEVNHTTPEQLYFIIIDDGISLRNRTRIENSINTDMSTIEWRNSKTVIPAGIKLPLDQSAFPLTTYLRLFTPYILPEKLCKVLYLDVDMIFLTDVSKLWNIDLKEHLFAAVQDIGKTVCCSWGGIPNYRQLNIPEKTKYFNAGLLLLNPQKWQELDVTNRVIDTMHKNIKYVNYADQYGLNAVLYNQWMELDPRWNSFASSDAYEDPYAIHFLDIKPIFRSYRSSPLYQNHFFTYLDMTEWKDFKLISSYQRLVRKVYNKVKKRILNTLAQ